MARYLLYFNDFMAGDYGGSWKTKITAKYTRGELSFEFNSLIHNSFGAKIRLKW